MSTNSLILGVTFSLFAIESLIHYQIGVWQEDGPVQFPSLSLPNAKDAMAMAVTSAIFSGLSVVAQPVMIVINTARVNLFIYPHNSLLWRLLSNTRL